MEYIIAVALLILAALVIMVLTNVLYDLFSATLPVAGLLVMAVGIVVGFVVAIKNTFTTYVDVYGGRLKK